MWLGVHDCCGLLSSQLGREKHKNCKVEFAPKCVNKKWSLFLRGRGNIILLGYIFILGGGSKIASKMRKNFASSPLVPSDIVYLHCMPTCDIAGDILCYTLALLHTPNKKNQKKTVFDLIEFPKLKSYITTYFNLKDLIQDPSTQMTLNF